MNNKYLEIVKHYEECLEQYGDSHLGVDWPNEKDAKLRYEVMAQVIKPEQKSDVSLLDFGCGVSHFYDYLSRNCEHVIYTGLDLSEKFVSFSKDKYPNNNYFCADILNSDMQLPCFDYIILNGVFTEKRELSFDEMFDFFKKIIVKLFPLVNSGMAFNVMSKHVDWERDDLFHLSYDLLADFLVKNISRNFVIRNDYGLYEYTVYIYK